MHVEDETQRRGQAFLRALPIMLIPLFVGVGVGLFLRTVLPGVPEPSGEGARGRYAYTRNGSPAKVAAPPVAGPCEIRYRNGYDNRILARADIEVTGP